MNEKNVGYIREVAYEPNALRFLGGDVVSPSLVVLKHLLRCFPRAPRTPQHVVSESWFDFVWEREWLLVLVQL
jgi:hypothetical protein